VSADFEIPKGRLLPILTATLTDDVGPIDLTGATVKFQMRPPGVGTTLKVDAAATVVSAATGQVSYTWSGTDTDTEGLYVAWFEVTYSGPKPLIAPEPPLVLEVTRGAG
jgi:hypothetical protein